MKTHFLAGAALMMLAACSQPTAKEQPAQETPPAGQQQMWSEQLDADLVVFLDNAWEEQLALSPESQTYYGRKTMMDQWDERTPAAANRRRDLLERQMLELTSEFQRDALSEEGKLNYDLFLYDLQQELALDDFRKHRFPLSQFRGIHSSIPVFLANYHKIETVEDARNYILRVSNIDTVLDQAGSQVEAGGKNGYTLPEFSYPLIAEAARNVITGAPFDNGDDSPILAAFKSKLEDLDASDEVKTQLMEDLLGTLPEVETAYQDFIARVNAVGETVEGNYGVGGPNGGKNGDAYYAVLLENYTTTEMTADEVHELGLSEVARIHEEMRAIMAEVGFDGTLQDFFDYMRTAEQFYLPNTDEGREAYLELARGYTDNIRPRLPDLFVTLPEAPVEVRRVEPFRERAAGKAFYNQPAPDGSRPGIFYANLADMGQMPTYQLEALVYHEAIPGHHMQRAIQIEMEGLPKFRQFGGFTAYTEGWGLYSEYLGKDLGFYEDPYSDFGRLAMELWRAARLVVDTGLHSKGWEMQEAIDYLIENTPNPEGDCVKAIERYIVYPGQATAYKIGMNKLLELRGRAQNALGEDFDIAEFHDRILTAGPVPLEILERRVDEWIAEKQDA
ncbi:DUF885 domain-containing protein [Parvularcula flava]|uniref:DUF885 domain-containing protein n=1 Tax=Aquisalinus luteolus TaxID=1566827 RepID=A0A8J3A1Q2_9PROT|nr:DUF885 domain-containing protein [Aquisalinus luteolus]NHK27790.1 DUF885 domain-containing protein [Aquisalinus luteolus]GGH96510.1 hypothetical protein GCM10011355_15580 [Aquisalinus luteolus]